MYEFEDHAYLIVRDMFSRGMTLGQVLAWNYALPEGEWIPPAGLGKIISDASQSLKMTVEKDGRGRVVNLALPVKTGASHV